MVDFLLRVLPCYRILVPSLSVSSSRFLRPLLWSLLRLDLWASSLLVASLRSAVLRCDLGHRRCSRGLALIPRVFLRFWRDSSKTDNFIGIPKAAIAAI